MTARSIICAAHPLSVIAMDDNQPTKPSKVEESSHRPNGYGSNKTD